MLKPIKENKQLRAIRQRKLGHHHQPQGEIAAMLGFAQSYVGNSEYLTWNNQDKQNEYKKVMKEITTRLCKEHPSIAIDPDMVGGMPHIKGIRLSVGTILAKLYIYGSLEKIKEIYGDDVSEDQIKEAVAYAQDFLESAYVHS